MGDGDGEGNSKIQRLFSALTIDRLLNSSTASARTRS